jgi:hypothetical protein
MWNIVYMCIIMNTVMEQKIKVLRVSDKFNVSDRGCISENNKQKMITNLYGYEFIVLIYLNI